MQASGGFPIDLVLFAMIAAFLVLRLRSILGKRTGFEGAPSQAARPAPRAPAVDVQADAAPPPGPARVLPDPQSPAGQALLAMQTADPHFDPSAFLTGAENAFRLIVAAFAAGDRERLRPLLAEDTFRIFDAAIAGRAAASQIQRTEIKDVLEASISDASLSGTRAAITVHFVSQQVNITLDADGTPVAGTDAVTEIGDLWSFARDLSQADLAWRLTDARSA